MITDKMRIEVQIGDILSIQLASDREWYRGRLIDIDESSILLEHVIIEEQTLFEEDEQIEKLRCRYRYPIDDINAYGVKKKVI